MGRGQAAVEFLATYGWAILVILIAIGALGYLGVLNFQKLIPEKCIVTTGFNCIDHQLAIDDSDDLTLNLILSNDMGSSINITKLNITCIDCNQGLSSSITCGSSQILKSSEQVEFTCPLQGMTAVENKKTKLTFDFFYTPIGKRYPKPASGEIVTEVVKV